MSAGTGAPGFRSACVCRLQAKPIRTNYQARADQVSGASGIETQDFLELRKSSGNNLDIQTIGVLLSVNTRTAL